MSLKSLKESYRRVKDDRIFRAESAAVGQFYQKVMKEDGISYEECLERCRTDPKYSLGVKLQIYMVDSTLDVRHVKQYKSELMQSLSPEEKEIYDSEVAGLNMTKMVKDAVKGRKR